MNNYVVNDGIFKPAAYSKVLFEIRHLDIRNKAPMEWTINREAILFNVDKKREKKEGNSLIFYYECLFDKIQ